MPKIVDNYVLERKIGSGQFGDVFKGVNKLNNTDIAIKVVKRELLKGKFNELLENEIRVLKTCNNDNIIKLYDIKKTANNFYLILEFCNEGDLMTYLKEKKYLTEDEAVEYIIQILNAFKTLVKNKIMHRDFKLANILKHNGNIKIADFGFAKLLGNDNMASTMLGSPLNMAPEVLNGQEYDNKADIWSIGTVFFELLFGKPPYTAGNMIDLIKNIQSKPLEIPRKVTNISEVAEDFLRKTLVVDPKKRIEWEDLFNHKITHFMEDKIKQQLEDTLNGDGMLALNMSRFYIKNNIVIQHPSDINKKEDLNDYAINVAKTGAKKNDSYKGAIIKRQTERNDDGSHEDQKNLDDQQHQQLKLQQQQSNDDKKTNDNDDPTETKESVREMQIRIKKRNSNRILHERNIYVFLASVAEEAVNYANLKYSELVGFLLVKKLLQMVDFLAKKMTEKVNVFKLDLWDVFVSTKDFQDIFLYIQKEHDVFKMYFNQMYEKVNQNVKIQLLKIDQDVKACLTQDITQNIDKPLKKVLKEYSTELIQHNWMQTKDKDKKEINQIKLQWIHADRILDCLKLEETFVFEDQKTKQLFNFKQYYDESDKIDMEHLIKKIETKSAAVKSL